LSKEKNEILIIGHRGASKVAPENTLLAFEKSIELKADYIEFDLRKTKDGEVVIIHDSNTIRTTGYDGEVRDMMLSELKQIDFGDGERIPTLKELVNSFGNRIGFLFDFATAGLAEDVVKILKHHELKEKPVFSSFITSEILKLREIDKELRLGYLIIKQEKSKNRIMKTVDKAVKNQFYSMNLYFDVIDKEMVRYVHNSNLKIYAWTVNERNDIKNLIDLGVDAIITDDVLLAKELLDAN